MAYAWWRRWRRAPSWRTEPADVRLFEVTLTLKARVRGGHLIIEEAVDLPEGTEVDLTVVDPGDDLDEAERARLHAALLQAQTDLDSGRSVPAADVLTMVRERRRR